MMSESQKKYQNSEKGKATRAKYQAKKALKGKTEPKVQVEPEVPAEAEAKTE